MNREDYRKAVDSLSFSPDFQARTEAALRQRFPEMEKETNDMNWKHTKKLALCGIAAAVLMAATVSAAYFLRSPAEVAVEMGDSTLADAFQAADAVEIGETARISDYTVTLMGLVSGRNLSEFGEDLDQDHTFVMVSLARTDGTVLVQEDYDAFAVTVTPLVAGYPVHMVNNWTLGAFSRCLVIDGMAYYILDVQNLEMFADRTVYLAVYEGFTPSADQFNMGADGSISYAQGQDGALFSLPLDPEKADPAAVKQFLKNTGLEFSQQPQQDSQPQTDTAEEAAEDNTPFLVLEAH